MNFGLGCHINGTYYMGSYADVITLSCPNVQGLNKMINIGSDFATNIKYGESVKLNEHGILNGNVISWHTGVSQGNFLNSCLHINVDSNRTFSHCIGYYNHMMSNFGHLNPASLVILPFRHEKPLTAARVFSP